MEGSLTAFTIIVTLGVNALGVVSLGAISVVDVVYSLCSL